MPLLLGISLEYLTANESFQKFPSGIFSYGAYVSPKNDSRSLTQKM